MDKGETPSSEANKKVIIANKKERCPNCKKNEELLELLAQVLIDNYFKIEVLNLDIYRIEKKMETTKEGMNNISTSLNDMGFYAKLEAIMKDYNK